MRTTVVVMLDGSELKLPMPIDRFEICLQSVGKIDGFIAVDVLAEGDEPNFTVETRINKHGISFYHENY